MTGHTFRQTSALPRRSLLTAGCGLALAGCGAATDIILGQPPALYTLTPKSTFDADLPTVNWQLLVETPIASGPLDTVRIALKEDAFRIQYFADVAWSARAPEMVQTLIVESFENSDRIVSVGRESIGLRADYVMKSELREFQAEYDGASLGSTPPQIRVRLNVKLVRIPERIIIASSNIERIEQPTVNDIPTIIEAFDTALGKVLRRAVEGVLREGERDWQARLARFDNSGGSF